MFSNQNSTKSTKFLFHLNPKSFIKNIIHVIFVFFIAVRVSAQQVVITGTEFKSGPGSIGFTYIRLNNIIQYGVTQGNISSPLSYPAEGTSLLIFKTITNHLVTKNPSDIDVTSFVNVDDEMFIYNIGNGDPRQTVLEYTAANMVPLTAVTVTIDFMPIVKFSATSTICNNKIVQFKTQLNPDATTAPVGVRKDEDSPQPGIKTTLTSATQTITGLSDANGKLVVRIVAPQGESQPCFATGITKIEIKGTLKVTGESEQGPEVCVKERISLKPTVDFDGTYQWKYRKVGGSWANLGTATTQSFEAIDVANYEFQFDFTPKGSSNSASSNIIPVSAIACCQAPNGAASSRQTIFYDDFGTLTDLANGNSFKVWDYSTPNNPVQKTVSADAPFRLKISPAPLGTNFVATSTVNTDQYAVVADITQAKLDWSSNITGFSPNPPINYDHSGTREGAALLINVPATLGSLYNRTFTNLCTNNGSKIYFECYITVYTDGNNPVDIKVKLDGGGPIVTENVKVGKRGSSSIGLGIKEGWVRIAAEVTLAPGTNTLKMSIDNNTAITADGNDLVIDDIKIMSCAPPAIDLVFNKSTLIKDTLICKNIPLIPLATDNLKNYYNNTEKYIYEITKTPLITSSWQRIAVPYAQNDPSSKLYILPDILTYIPTLAKGDKVYFRVVADKSAIAPAGGYNINDPCRTYSVSEPIEGTYDCPACSTPTSLTVKNGTATIADAGTLTVCEKTAISLDLNAAWPAVTVADKKVEIYVINSGGVSTILKTIPDGSSTTSTTSTYSIPANLVSTALNGTYTIGVRNGTCKLEQKIVIKVNALPIVTATPSKSSICTGDAVTLKGDGASTYTWDNSVTNGTAFIPAATNTYTVTGTDASGCKNTKATTVTVNTLPVVTATPSKSSICTGDAVTLKGGGASTYTWDNSVTNGTAFTPAATNTYTVTGTDANGCKNTKTTTVTVTSAPVVTATPSKSSICSGDPVTLTGGGASTYIWDNNVTNNTPFNPAATTTYTVTGTDANGCRNTKTTTITVNAIPTVGAISPVTDMCEGTKSRFGTANSKTTSTYTWTVTGTGAIASANTGSLIDITAGTSDVSISVAEEDANGCKSLSPATKIINVDNKPAVPNAGLDLPTCGTTYTLLGSTPSIGTGLWTSDNAAVTFDDATKPGAKAINIPEAVTVRFTYKITNGLCSSSDSVDIKQIGKMSDPNAGSARKVCGITGLVVDLKGNTSLNTSETVTWSKKNTSDPGTLTQTGNDAKVTGLTLAGTYTYVLTMKNGVCPDNPATVDVLVINQPVATILTPASTPATYRDNDYTLTATTLTSGYKGQWVADSVGVLIGDTTQESVELRIPTFKNIKIVSWIVRDENRICTPDKKTVTITRLDFTLADAEPNKNVCITPATNFSLSGNSFTTGTETAVWTLKSGNATINEDPLDKSKATFVPNGGAGVYEFYYSITNTSLAKTTKDSVTVRVDAESLQPTFSAIGAGPFTSASPYVICTDALVLAGDKNNQTLGKNWWTKATGTGTLPVADSTHNPNLSAISGKVDLIYTYKNGVCPIKTKAFVLEKLGNLSAAKVKLNGGKSDVSTKQYVGFEFAKASNILADTLCLGGSYTLKANPFAVASEIGTWSFTGNSVLPTVVDDSTRSITATASGNTVIKWKIASTSIATCKPDSIVFTLVVRDVPTGIVSGPSPVCEGAEGTYSVVVTSSMTNYKTTWVDTTALTGKAVYSSLNAKYTFTSSATTGDKDVNGIVKVKVTNRCGSTFAPLKQVDIALKPRDFTGTIDGDGKSYCSSSIGNIVLGIQKQTNTFENTSGYEWTFDGNTIPTSSTKYDGSIPSDSAYVNESFWNNYPATSTVPIKVTLKNACGTGVSKSGSVTITKAEPLKATLASSTTKFSNNLGIQRVCTPNQQTVFVADNDNGIALVDATYKFYKGADLVSTSIGNTLTYLGGELSDLDEFTVTVSSTKGCFTGGGTSIASNTIAIDGYAIDTTMNVTGDFRFDGTQYILCSDKSLDLNVVKVGKKNTYYKWYKDGGLASVDSSTTRRSTSISLPDQTGEYQVKIFNEVCDFELGRKVNVKVFQKPAFDFVSDPLIIVYENEIKVPMPVVVYPSADPITKTTWSDYTWLTFPVTDVVTLKIDSAKAVIVPERIQTELNYSLTLKSGPTNLTCETTKSLLVINSLPLNIPNAFSPNGDGVNDTWVITGLNKYKKISIRVFNRWGNQVFFDQDGYKNAWDGNINGISLATGTYYAIIELSGSPDGSDQTFTRSLTIVR